MKGDSLYQIEWELPQTYNKISIDLFFVPPDHQTNLVSISIENLDKKLSGKSWRKRVRKIQERCAIQKNRAFNWIKRNPLILFPSLILLLLISGVAWRPVSFGAIVQSLVVILNTVLIYLIFTNQLKDWRKRDRDLAENVEGFLSNLNRRYYDCRKSIEYSRVDRDVYSFINSREIPAHMKSFIKTEVPTVLMDLRKIEDELSQYALELGEKTENKLENKMGEARENC